MRYVTILLAVIGIGLAPARAETLEQVEKKVTDLMAKHKSVEMKMKTKTDINQQGMVMKSTSESTVVYGKKGDRWLSRSDTKMSGTSKFGDQPETKDDSRIQTVYDGQYIYTLTESSQGKQAMKMKPPHTDYDPFNGKQMWEDMHKSFDVKLLPDETVDGKSTWAIESRPRPEKDAPPEAKSAMAGMRSVTYYRKSDGVAVKSVSYDKDNKPTITMNVTDVKYDVNLKPDMFKFTVPEGVTVMDMDQLKQNSESADKESSSVEASPEPKAQDQPTEEPKKQESTNSSDKPKSKEKGAKGLLNRLRR